MNSLKEKKECPGKEIRLLWRHIIMRQTELIGTTNLWKCEYM